MSEENSDVDAMASMAWNEGKALAALAKDIVAFANSRDGGTIVIGKSQNDGSCEFVCVRGE